MFTFIICFLAGIGAGLGIGFAGMRAVSAYTYHKNKNLDMKNGLMLLLILTSVLGYDLKTAVGTSVFIMAFTGSASHFVIGGMPELWILLLCALFTLLWARIAA